MKIPYLESERLTLRELTMDDAENLFELDRDPNVMKYLTNGKPSTREEIKSTLERVTGYYEKFDHKFGTWAAIEKSTGDFIGWFLLRPDKKDLENTQDLELGYRFKAKYWGKGYATEVSRLLVEKAFKEFNAKTVFANAMKGNNNSINVMKKVGLKFHSNFIQEDFSGADKNAVRYVMTREEWR